VPVGVIVMWSGYNENIPTGWALCNGQTVNGVKTPDLRGRFIYAAEGNRIGELGEVGNAEGWHTGEPFTSTYRTSFTMYASDLPQHTHPLTSDSTYKVPASNKTIEDIKSTGNGACAWDGNYTGSDFEMITTTKLNTGCGSLSKTFSISIPKPSFYTLAFIMKIR
jgi:microcystin-dependent protein